MYLSRLTVNARSQAAWRDLADRYELHRTLLSAFPATLAAAERLLYRVEQRRDSPAAAVLVQSHTLPDWSASARLALPDYLLTPPEIRLVQPAVQAGERYPFRLHANPVVKRDGKRHGLVTDDALAAWLARKSEQHGFRVLPESLRVASPGRVYGQRRQQTWYEARFDGVLMVTETEHFSAALRQGIGSAKAFGFGLLSIPYRSF